MHTNKNSELHPAGINKSLISVSNEWIPIVVCSAVNLLLLALLISTYTEKQSRFTVFGMNVDYYIFSGFAVQAQVLLNTYISIKTMRKGYITVILLNAIGICFAGIGGVAIGGHQGALPGVVTYFSSMVISAVIYYYKRGLDDNIRRLTEQKDEITSLYKEISASREKLGQQNEQLIWYNKVMKENEKKLERMAYYDPLTGLPNRKMIIKKLDMLIHYSKRTQAGFALVCVDIDNFKEINDLMGHFAGDKLLEEVTKRWKARLNKRDVLGRLEGDEFAIIIRRELSRDEILRYVGSFRDAITDVFRYDLKEINIDASFGISIYPNDGNTTEDLLKHAGMAQAVVKSSGKHGIEFYRNEMQKNMIERVQLEDGLKSAIMNDELYVVFQPQYSCDTQEIRGFEALARWRSPGLGTVSPVKFIPVAEETGLIIDIGEWILRTVVYKFKKVIAVKEDCILTVNISVVQLIQPSFVPMVKRVLEETGFDGSRLEFEITESVFISYPEKVSDTLRQLKEMGIRIALDDFGTGYASLKNLQMLPIDTLKIDRAFVSRIGEMESGNQIVGSIIALAHSLGIYVVAEGVENMSQMNYLREQKCDCVQGFLLSMPLESDQVDELIAIA
jgi:diguanylate cyclase (GGDEF)-like protein